LKAKKNASTLQDEGRRERHEGNIDERIRYFSDDLNKLFYEDVKIKKKNQRSITR